MCTSRQHSAILQDAGGAVSVRRLLVERAITVSVPTVQSWITRNSIPAAYWADLTALGVTTLEELAAAAQASVARDLSQMRTDAATGTAEAISGNLAGEFLGFQENGRALFRVPAGTGGGQ